MAKYRFTADGPIEVTVDTTEFLRQMEENNSEGFDQGVIGKVNEIYDAVTSVPRFFNSMADGVKTFFIDLPMHILNFGELALVAGMFLFLVGVPKYGRYLILMSFGTIMIGVLLI